MPTIIHPSSEQHWLELRTQDVTSTESAALFGMSPYSTRFELWHRKKSGAVVEIPDNERMKWGRRLQDAIAYGIAEDQGWVCEPMKEYMRHDKSRMGSSFDFRMIDDSNRIGVFEIKNVDFIQFRNTWLVNEDGSIEAPEHIEIQLQHQLEVCGYEWGAIGVLVAGNDPKVLIRNRDAEVGAAIRKRVDAFWATVISGDEPAPEYPQDAHMVCELHQYAEPGKVFDAQGDANIAALLAQYHQAGKDEREAKERKDTAKAKLLEVIGDAEKVLADGFTVSAGVVSATIVPAYERKGFRNFRVTAKKVKEAV